MFLQMSQRLTGRGENKKREGSLLSPLLRRFRAR
jgi:hypothetical protein